MKDAACRTRRAVCWGMLGLSLLLALALGGCSESSGATWEGIGLNNKPVTSLAFGPQNSQTIFAGSTGQGLFRSLDGGGSWSADTTGLPAGITVSSIVYDPVQIVIYLGTDAGLFQSSDDGDHWQSALQGLPPGADGAVTAIALNSADSLTLYAGTAQKGVYVSHDGAKSWSASSQGLPANAAVHALVAVGQNEKPHLYVALAGAGVYQSTDAGASWSASSDGLPSGVDGLSLLWQPSDPGGLYVGTSAGIYRSTDSGASWEAVNNGLGQAAPQVYALALNDQDPTFLFAGTSAGAYRSDDGGANWGEVASGLPSGQGVMALVVQGSKASLGIVFVGANGIYRYPSQAVTSGGRIVQGIVIGILVALFVLLFFQQRRVMQRLMPKQPAQPGQQRPQQPGPSAPDQRNVLRDQGDQAGLNGAEPKKPS